MAHNGYRCKMEGKWGLSRDEELYRGAYASKAEALADADDDDLVVGQYQQPAMPWEIGRPDADEIIEAILCHEDYAGEWASDSLEFTKEQGAELEAAVARVLRDWCLKHNVLPEFGLVDPRTVETIQRPLRPLPAA